MVKGGDYIRERGEPYGSRFTTPDGLTRLFPKDSNSRFGHGFGEEGNRVIYPMRFVNPIVDKSYGEDVRVGPLKVASVDGVLIVLNESPIKIQKEGTYIHNSQGYSGKHLVFDSVQEIAEDHAPPGANLYTPFVMEIDQDFLELQRRVVEENFWQRPRGKKARKSLRARKRAIRAIERDIDRKVRRRWRDYVSEFHPVLGINYFRISQEEIERIQGLVDLIDNTDIPWPENNQGMKAAS